MKSLTTVLITLFLFSCSKDFQHPEKIRLGTLEQYSDIRLVDHVRSNWNSVCIFAPYSTDELAKQLLGFNWPLEELTTVWVLDNVNLLVFVENSTVTKFVEVHIEHVNFIKVASKCYPRSESTFKFDEGYAVVSI